MKHFKNVNGTITTVENVNIVEVDMYSLYDGQEGEYYMEMATLLDLQEDVFETINDRGEAHDDELGEEYSYIIDNFEPKDLSLEFVLEFYRDYEYIVIKHNTVTIK